MTREEFETEIAIVQATLRGCRERIAELRESAETYGLTKSSALPCERRNRLTVVEDHDTGGR